MSQNKKSEKNKINFFFFGVMLGPYIKSRGTRGTKMSANADLITVETLCTTRGNDLKTSFSFMSQNVNKIYILGLFWGPWGGLQWSDWAYLAFQLSSHPCLCTCELRKQSDKQFLSLNPKYENIILFFIFGGSWGGLTSNPGKRKFQGSKTS